MDTFERTKVTSTKTVHIEKRWKVAEFTGNFSRDFYSSPELFLLDDPTKKLQLVCSVCHQKTGCVSSFTLRVAIEVPWTCRGNCKTFLGNQVQCSGRDVTGNGTGGYSVDIKVFEINGLWDFVEINFAFFLDEDADSPMMEWDYLPMSCAYVCDKLLTDDAQGPYAFVLKVEGKEIVVHGAILGMHSEVLKRMVEQDGFREARERVIEITDADYDSVVAMVRFMHGFNDAAREHPEGVLALADKYAVEPLKEFAVAKLKERIGRSTVAHIAAVAILHDVPTLFKECKEYVAANLRKLSATPEWKNLRDTNAELLLKLVCDNNDD